MEVETKMLYQKREDSFKTLAKTEKKLIMDISYMIMVHKNPLQLKRLVHTLQAERVKFYIHVNIQSDIGTFLEALPPSETVYYVPDEERKATPWGNTGILEAEMVVLRKIMEDKRTGYVILLSGQDYPLKDNVFISNFFKQNKGINFIELFALPSERWSNKGVCTESNDKDCYFCLEIQRC